MDFSPYRTSQKLIKCYAINEKGERSLRFIELENFKAQIPEHLLCSDTTEITVVSGYSVVQRHDEVPPCARIVVAFS